MWIFFANSAVPHDCHVTPHHHSLWGSNKIPRLPLIGDQNPCFRNRGIKNSFYLK